MLAGTGAGASFIPHRWGQDGCPSSFTWWALLGEPGRGLSTPAVKVEFDVGVPLGRPSLQGGPLSVLGWIENDLGQEGGY